MTTHHIYALVIVLAAPAAAAQSDSTARPTGGYTTAQAARGEGVYRETCAQCHALTQFSGVGFLKSWAGQPAYPLFTLIRTTMPFDSPGRLRRDEYADVVAYLLRLNGVPPGKREFPSDDDALRRVRIPAPPDTTR